MSIALTPTETIRGVAGSATSITYTITGAEKTSSGIVYKVLAQGQLPSTIGTLYTVPASTYAVISSIHLTNETGGTVTARLAVNGTAAANTILPAASILAGGWALYGDDGWTFYNDQGQALGVGATGATGAQGDPGDPGASDHGALTGLADDDHTQYIKDSEFTAAGDTLRGTGAGTFEAVKNNLAATAAPAVTDDDGDGYSVGSRWIDTTNDRSYECVDASTGAAVWKQTSNTAGAATIAVREVGGSDITDIDTVEFVAADFDVTDQTGGVARVALASPGGGGGASDPIQEMFGTPTTAFEFATSSLTGLTSTGFGTVATENADTSVTDQYYISGGSQQALLGRYVTAPSEPWTAIAKVTDGWMTRENPRALGTIFAGTSTLTGGVEVLKVRYSSTVGGWVVHHKYWSGNPPAPNSDIYVSTVPIDVHFPLYLAIKATSATSIDSYVSQNGYIWFRAVSARNPGYALDSVGFGLALENTVGYAVFDFFRIWDSALTFTIMP
jgi:hypothetical protein